MSGAIFKSSFALPAPPSAASGATVSSLCPSDLPLVLMPVRLETRFFPQADGSSELRIRIYPDKVHLDSHEPELLVSEMNAGMQYWDQDWRAGADMNARADAWSQLADHFGAERAAWIARVTAPTNPQARPLQAVPAGTALDPAIAFPSITPVADPQAQAWRHAPQARLLPDRWIVTLTSGTTTIQTISKDIVRPLAVGPDPAAPAQTSPLDQLGIDAGMKWMVDFDEAEDKGMGVRIVVPASVLAAGIDSVLVFGVSASLAATDGATQLATLLDAHHYTDGLDFLRFGTPTNNTDDRRAPQLTDDPGHARSFGIEVAADPATFPSTANALRVGTALGLFSSAIPEVLGHVGNASAEHEGDMRSMNAALWQVGWGYYLTNMVGFDGTGLTPPVIDWVRDHFVTHVRAGGPYPVLRFGRQPYGVMPVTSLDLWQTAPGQESLFARDEWTRKLLITLRDTVWRPRLGDVFRLGRRTGATGPQPDADLADVMRVDGISSGYTTRAVFGRHYFQQLRAFLGEDVGTGFIPAQDSLANELPRKLGFSWRPRVAKSIDAELSFPVTGPLVQGGEVSPERTLEPNYIATLLTLKTADFIAPIDPTASNAPKTLLEALLRHSLMRETANATAQLAAAPTGLGVSTLLHDAELNDLVTGAPPSLTWKRQLTQPAPVTPPGPTIQTFLDGLTTFDAPSVASLGDFRRSLAHLQALDTETLQYLMQGTLDLSSHRLDAWITSFATKRLAAIRADKPSGVYVGAYGWVENLRPVSAASLTAVATPPVGETGPIFAATNDGGFIHAPSMTHAAAAAVLRNAHLGPTGVPTSSSPFAIDLSSHRVREADRLLDGVRQGQPLGALLGYRIERSLHELGLDTAIPVLRSLAPLTPAQNADANTPTEAIAANNVVDGLALFNQWSQDRTGVTGKLQPVVGADRIGGVVNELDALAASIDGLSDALTAEAAYQIARGNTSRAAATLASIARGDAPPPELEVARTPRSGTSLSHRVMALFSGTTSLSTPGWLAWSSGTISAAEPLLNFWAAKLLGDGSKTRCTVERLEDSTGAVVETMTFKVSDLSIEPLQFVYGVEASTNASAAQPVSALSQVEQLVLYHARRATPGFGPSATIRIQHARPTNLAAGEITLFDMLEQAKALRRLLANARGITPEDLNPPERTATSTMNLVELEARVVKAENALLAANKALAAVATPKAKPKSETLRTDIQKMGLYGVGAAVPVNGAGDDPASITALKTQASAILRASGPRVDQINANRAQPIATDPRARLDQLVARMRTVFGQSFVVLPHFTLEATAAKEFASAVAASKQALGGDVLAANSWLTRYARVRDTVARFATALRGADVLGTGDHLNLSVAQLPFVSGERWIGLPPLAGTTLPVGKLSLVLQAPMTIKPTGVLSGLLIDEWTEVVPNDHETTAITFQYDPPDSTAPQAILIAVPPVPGVDWTSDTLQRVLLETLDLAKLRAVDPELLGETAQYLPALYTAFNVNNDAVSTDFTSLTQ